MATLYVCVDESGRQDEGNCYSVAACWFVSERRPLDALDSTKDKLIRTMFGTQSGVSELKGSKANTDAVNAGIGSLRKIVYDDSSLEQRSSPGR
jgi:hypothetical protein